MAYALLSLPSFIKIENGGTKKMKNELGTFNNEEFGQIRTLVINDKPYFVASDIAKALGYKRPNDAISTHCRYTVKHSIPHPQSKTKTLDMNIIPEGDMYRLITHSELPSSEKFESWVFDDVLPTIRKTGGYVNNDNLFIDTYLPFADENTKLLFSTTLETVRKQNELIKKQQEEILHKQEVINGLTDDVDIYKKRAIINRICKRRHGNYANRYKELYMCFRETFHIDLEARCEGYNLKQIKKKDRLTVIAYAEKFGHIDDLYSCCAKLYETEVNEILEELRNVQE